MNILFEGIEKLSKKFLTEDLSWQKIKDSLQASIDDGHNPLDKSTDVRENLNNLCLEVEHKLNLFVELSTQAGHRGVFFFYNHKETGYKDYETFNKEVVDLALESDSAEEFKSRYEDYIAEYCYYYEYEDDDWEDIKIEQKDQTVIIPDGVTEITADMIDKNVKSVIIPSSVKKIGKDAFARCKFLQSIIIPDSVTEIGFGAFTGCESLQSITIPNSVNKIGGFAFAHCFSLQSVTIPASVTEIEASVFDTCRSLQSVTIPESLTYISRDAFNACKSLQSVKIPNSVAKIEEGAFARCESLEFIKLPKNLSYLGEDVFKHCYSLEGIIIPKSIDPSVYEGKLPEDVKIEIV